MKQNALLKRIKKNKKHTPKLTPDPTPKLTPDSTPCFTTCQEKR